MLFHSFWAFLFVFSGIVNIGLGILSYFTGALSAEDSPLPTFVICLIVGSVYLAIGIAITLVKKPKRTP